MASATAPQNSFPTIDGRKIQLAVGGEGPPLLYLHSAAGEADWLPFHERLANRFRVHLPAHPGFGLSEFEGISDIQDMAWHYVDLLDGLQLPQVDVVAFSLGGWLALELALLRPERVRRMALIAPAGLHLSEAPIAELFIDDLDELRRMLFLDPESQVAREFFPQSMTDPSILLWLRAREATARVGWNPYLHNPKLRRHLRRIQQSTLLLWGRRDAVIPVAHGEFYAQHLPHAQLEVWDHAGHMLPFEQPAETADRAAAFLLAQ